MNIKVNGEAVSVAPVLSLGALLKERGVEAPEMVSVQLNGRFVDRSAYPTMEVKESDEVDFLYFLGGGSR